MRNISLHNYVWKLEAHKDGRLHVHLSTDIFYHYNDLRSAWNRILQREGLLDYHFKKFNDYNPNSTDVHAVQKIYDMAAYLAKYISKSYQNEESFKGKIWGQSKGLSKFKLPTFEIDKDVGHDLIDLMKNSRTRVLKTENCCIIKPPKIKGRVEYPTHLQSLINNHIKTHKDYEKNA
jgi:hypothetical protein